MQINKERSSKRAAGKYIKGFYEPLKAFLLKINKKPIKLKSFDQKFNKPQCCDVQKFIE